MIDQKKARLADPVCGEVSREACDEAPCAAAESCPVKQLSFTGRLRAVWKARKPFAGWGFLLVYCHAVMFSSAAAELRFAGVDRLRLFLVASDVLVPVVFALTTASLFVRPFFFIAVALGVAHAMCGLILMGSAVLVPSETGVPFTWVQALWYGCALVGMLCILAITLLRRSGFLRLPQMRARRQ